MSPWFRRATFRGVSECGDSCNTVNKSAMDKKCAQLWQRLSAALKPQISADSFKRWFSAVELDRGQRQIAHASVFQTTSISFGSRVITCRHCRLRIVTTFWQPALGKVLLAVGTWRANARRGCRAAGRSFAGTAGRHKTRRNRARTQSTEHVRIFRGWSEQRNCACRKLLPWRRRRRARTTRCSFMAVSVLARPT